MTDLVGAVLVAAGSSRRMGFDKLWSMLGPKPVVRYALEALLSSSLVDRLALVVSPERLADASALVTLEPERARLCRGGDRRRDSVAAGLAALPECEWILVHDAARPFLTECLIRDGLAAARATGAAVAGLPSRDTIKRVDHGFVAQTLPREQLWSVQTPQVFRRALLAQALGGSDEDVTDEATLVERSGGRVAVYLGSDRNVKLTTPGDFQLAEAMLQAGRPTAAAGRAGR